MEKKCASLVGNVLMRRFVLLSSDLVRILCKVPATPLTDRDVPDVAIANALYTSSEGSNLQTVELNGLVAKTSKADTVGDFLNAFDRYKDKVTVYEDRKEEEWVSAKPTLLGHEIHPPRLLLGILSMDTPLEKERRQMIRQTYLSAYRSSQTPSRICSLAEIDTLENKRDCQMAYVFVLGGNPKGPTELVDVTDETGPLTIPPPDGSPSDESDLVYLNIRENGKEGKSQTYFKFATTVLENHYFDYLGKTDTDTLLYTKLFFEKSLANLPKFPNNMRTYAGDYRIKPSKESLNLGPAYMGGHFYMMSPDLARYIVSPKCNRSALAVFSEDQSIGNFIHSLNQPIRRLRISTFYFEHPVKRVDRMKTLWRKRQAK